jgi:SAM-dependent methyltransferase
MHRDATNLHYIAHLAEFGITNLHPFAGPATGWLLAALDLRPGQQVLEVGCGTAGTLVRVALACSVQVTGVDALPPMLQVARRRLALVGLGKRATVRAVRPGASLPFPEASFDRVYTESVLGFQDAAAARRMLGEIGRVLRPGGRYVANEAIWRQGVPDATVAAITVATARDFGSGQASPQNWALDEWRVAMQAAGFEICSADTLEAYAARSGPPRPVRPSLRLLLSHLVTWLYRVRGYSSLRVIRRERRYRRLLQAHRAEGQYIEARLFVLQKPAR